MDRERTGLNWTADFSWYSWFKILSFDWSVSLKLCSDWLVNLLKEEFQEWHRQTDKQTKCHDRLLNCLLSQLIMWKKSKNYKYCSLCVPGWIFTLAFWLGYSNSVLNPVRLTENFTQRSNKLWLFRDAVKKKTVKLWTLSKLLKPPPPLGVVWTAKVWNLWDFLDPPTL